MFHTSFRPIRDVASWRYQERPLLNYFTNLSSNSLAYNPVQGAASLPTSIPVEGDSCNYVQNPQRIYTY